MPRISDDILDCAVYLYPTVEAAKQGLQAGGSGFLVGVRSKRFEDVLFTYLVTNRHVVKEGHCLVIRMNNQDGAMIIVESEDANWQEHPDGDDLAIIPVGLQPEIVKFKVIPIEMFVTTETIKDFDIGVGDDAYMVGRFITHDGKQKNMPAVQFGNISIMPIEPMQHESGRPQESFAIEMRSIGGFSGSPVFVKLPTYERRPNSRKMQGVSIGGAPSIDIFIGVVWGHINAYYPVYLRKGNDLYNPPDNLVAKANSYMAGVVPAWKLQELIDMEKFRLSRDQQEERIAEQRQTKISGISLDIALAEETTDEKDNMITREDFSIPLSKVSQPNLPPVDEESPQNVVIATLWWL